MFDLSSPKKPAASKSGYSNNPFARALAETEQSAYQPNINNRNSDTSLFSDAMAKTGGSMADSVPTNTDFMQQQQEEQERLRKRELLRKKLHDQVNPTAQENLFDAREKRVKEEIEKTRKELEMLAKDIAKFRKDIDIVAYQQVVEPGQQGTYYISFFQKLRAFIMLLRQKIKSARTWATQMNGKKKKKGKGKNGQSMSLEGKAGHEQTKTVFDTMHHEVSNARSGG